MNRLQLATQLVTWFGAGRSPKMSGTVGSLAALPFAYLIQATLGSLALLVASLIIFAVGIWASKIYLHAHPENQDPKEIVIDEVAGQWLTLCAFFPNWHSYLIGFLLFRLFDIVKPWPVSWADGQIKGAWGVMLDDMLAGFYPIFIYLLLLVIAQFGGEPVQHALQGILLFLAE